MQKYWVNILLLCWETSDIDYSVLLKSKFVPNIPLLLFLFIIIHPYRLMFPSVGLSCLWVNTTEIENC